MRVLGDVRLDCNDMSDGFSIAWIEPRDHEASSCLLD